MCKGYMMLSREKVDDFEWSCNPNVFYVFFKLLFKANYKDKKWEGVDVKRGQLVAGRKALSEELNLSEQQIRTCLDKLTKTGYINQQTTNKYTIITICEYDSWIGGQQLLQPTNNQQITNNQPTNNQQITTPIIKEIKEISKEEDTNVSKKKSSVFVPPSVEEVAEYIKQKGYHFNAQSFVDYYEADDWHYGKGANRKKVSNWKRCCSTWEEKRRNNSADMFAQPVSVQPQSSEATKKYYAYHIGFDTEAEADAFFEEQEKIREGIYNGTYKVTVRNVDDWLAQGNALKVVDGVVYDYDL